MPWFHDHAHYAEIALLLVAGDIQAVARRVHEASVVQISAEGERTVIWGNTDKHGVVKPWAFSVLEPDGRLHAGRSDIPFDAFAEDVAHAIAVFDYDAAIEEFRVAEAERLALSEDPVLRG